MKFWQMISVFQVSFQAQSMRQKCANPEGYQLFVGMTHDLDFGLFAKSINCFLENGVSKFNTIRNPEVYWKSIFLEKVWFFIRFYCFFTAEDFMCTYKRRTYLIDFSTIGRTVQLFPIGSCSIYIWHEWRIETIKKSTPSLDRWGQTKGHQKAQTKSPHGFWSDLDRFGQVWTCFFSDVWNDTEAGQ